MDIGTTDRVAENLARNLVDIRRRRSWSQARLADAAGIPRSTIANLETGAANPSLSTLASLSAALAVGIEELLARPRSACTLVRRDNLPRERRGGATVHHLLPERLRGLEIDRVDFEPGTSMSGTPHSPGTHEYFVCLSGEMRVLVAGESFRVGRGDLLAFPGDQPHSYRNATARRASAISVIVPVPAQPRGQGGVNA